MEKKMETPIVYRGYIGLYRGYYRGYYENSLKGVQKGLL